MKKPKFKYKLPGARVPKEVRRKVLPLMKFTLLDGLKTHVKAHKDFMEELSK